MIDESRKSPAGTFIPVAGLALALAAGAAAALAGFGSRVNLWHFRTGFAILKWAAYGGLAAARAMGWRIVAAEPREGRIEAIDTTFWFGFKDDIVVRVTAVDEYRSLVDIRSVSRVGRSDMGANARRIRAYLHRLMAGK